MRQLEHAKQRLVYARQNRQSFESHAITAPQQVRAWQKLRDDERKAEQDVGWLLHSLDTPEG